MILKKMRISILFLIFTFSYLHAYDPAHLKLKNTKPTELDGMELENKIGNNIPLTLKFTAETGEEISLSKFFNQGKPIVLSMVYYRCPTLCNYHLNGIAKVFKNLEWNLGEKYEFITVSIDPSETPDLAEKKRNAYMEDYVSNGKFRLPSGMSFLVGKEGEIKQLADSLGFKYKYNPGIQQWIHPAVAYVLTPEGKIARIFNGISFDERDLKLSLVEATNGKIGTMMDRVALFCFQFDPNKNKYTIYAYNMMRIGGGFTVLFIAGYLFTFWRKNKKIDDSNLTGEK
jgi:protein SCO1